MRIFVLTATYELRVSRKSHLRDHPTLDPLTHAPPPPLWSWTHTKRRATQHACLPSLLRDGDKGIEKVFGEEKIFCAGPNKAAKPIQKSLVPARQFQRTNKETLFHLYSLSPYSPQFQSQQGPILLQENRLTDPGNV